MCVCFFFLTFSGFYTKTNSSSMMTIMRYDCYTLIQSPQNIVSMSTPMLLLLHCGRFGAYAEDFNLKCRNSHTANVWSLSFFFWFSFVLKPTIETKIFWMWLIVMGWQLEIFSFYFFQLKNYTNDMKYYVFCDCDLYVPIVNWLIR